MFTRDDIEAEHDRLGYDLGWRFMMCPEETFWTSDVLVVGLNPSGRERHGPDWSSEPGNAYWTEAWGDSPVGRSALQQQVQRLAAFIGLGADEIGAAQFVPFRSNRWSDLGRSAEAVAFARRLWAPVLERSAARTFVCLGKNITGAEMAQLVGASLTKSTEVGWGAQTGERFEASDGRVVVSLPHLGTFKLFSRPKSRAGLATLLTP